MIADSKAQPMAFILSSRHDITGTHAERFLPFRFACDFIIYNIYAS